MPYGSGWDTQKASERPTWYPASRLHTAWGLLINASRTDCANTTATAFDIADVGREYISIAACNIAYDALRDAHTTAEIIKANATMGMVMADLDRLLAASGGFLLGQWISDARALAINAGHPEDANFLEWNGVCSRSLHRFIRPPISRIVRLSTVHTSTTLRCRTHESTTRNRDAPALYQ